jgi:hypothetical protein
LDTTNPEAGDEKKLNNARTYHQLTWFCAAVQVLLVIWGIVLFAGKTLTLPAGYAAMVLLALCPPLWFKAMEARLSRREEHLRRLTQI